MTVQLSGYQTGKLIYTGTRTLVYQGQRQSDDQPVVIKLLRNEYPTFSELLQFRNQYTIARNLDIPGIIRPYSLEYYRNSYALVMEDCGGISLNHCEPLTLEESLSIAIQLADILHGLHQNRVIHKDIKPANILIHPQSKQVKLIDFSIASLLPKETQEIKNPNGLEGTLAYISPEQTGRMNRGIDYRSDFYSLGVTLFELLTGKLPFLSTDPMELVHCHIAKQPSSVIREEMPPVVVDIVLKLMAKNAEDRYQSSLGLKFDVENCLYQLKETGKIEVWEIGKRDVCDRFMIPEKLYGREKEVQTLLEAFERVANGTSELMLVAGFSGIGKTAVVNEVHKPIVRQHGYFIKGKFDQFNRNIPLSAFVQAFRDLMGQLLSESDTQLQTWKTKILRALGENAQVIIEVIPELEPIIGVQPPAPELSGTAAKNRFNLLFQKFIQVFATKEHPLVMFLDDLQWADSASLKLMQLLMGESPTGYLLMIGAYRDNEVFPVHPLMLTLDEVGQAGATVNTITLEPLSHTSLNQLVADTLSCAEGLAQPLTELVAQKTKGNPFFTTQFLKALHQDELITFDVQSGHWQCDLVRVREAALTDDVVEFMVQQLQKLSLATQEVLKLAACIGNQFDLKTLAIVSEQSESEAADALWKALQEGLVIPQSETYKFFQAHNSESSDSAKPTLRDRSSEIIVSYKFLHDRVQQAAYSLIPEDQKQQTHLKIGQLLLEKTSDSQQEENILTIVYHLNIGIPFLSQKCDRDRLAHLNLSAGEKAKSSTAYFAALEYFRIGIDLLDSDCWHSQYDLTLHLYTGAAEAEYLNSNFAASRVLIDLALSQAKSLLHRVKLEEIKIQSYVVQNQLKEALSIGIKTLQVLGITLPKNPNNTHVLISFIKTKIALLGKSVKFLENLPEINDPSQLYSLKLLMNIAPAASLYGSLQFPVILFSLIQLSVRFGNSKIAAFAYASYGLMLCDQLRDIELGYRFGKLALTMLDRFDAREIHGRVHWMFNATIRPWKEPIQTTVIPLLAAMHSALDSGDLEFFGYANNLYSVHLFVTANHLEIVDRNLGNNLDIIKKARLDNNIIVPAFVRQMALNLMTPSETGYSRYSDILSNQCIEDSTQNNSDFLSTFNYCKTFLAYLFGHYQDAIIYSYECYQYKNKMPGLIYFSITLFYQSLALLADLHKCSKIDQRKSLKQVDLNQKEIQYWAHHCPENYQHQYDLVEAEKYTFFGKYTNSITYYDRAITGAKANGYIQEEALANELAAKFYLNWGKEKVAASYMQEAYYCYAKWGALAKTNDLEQRYPDLLRPILQQAAQTLNPLETLASLAAPNLFIHTSTQNSRSSSTSINTALDFAAILKASQSLSSTIQLDELLNQLTHIILQNSGADRCALILPSSNGEWQLQAIATPEKIELCSEPLENNPHLPIKLIQYVKNTQELVVIDNLKTDLPVIGEYLMRQQPNSILCLPLLSKGQLCGILYLENRSTVGVFTKHHLLILNFLCTQAAISLENARLYQQAQDYTQQLEQSQLQLVKSEKMSALGNLVAGVAHEINNPVGFIAGNLQPAQDYVKDLLGLLDLYAEEYPKPTETIEEEIEAIDLEFLREDLPKLIGSMKEGTDRISHISTSLRTFSRADSDRPTLFNLHDGIDSTLLILKHRLKVSDCRPAIEVIKNYGDLPQINCFAGQLNQVFMNLIANAIDAIDEGVETGKISQPCIQIHTEALENSVVIRIKDNAMGMPEEVKSRIFDHLFTTKSVGKGTGLGLAIARQIVVEKHGGILSCSSEVGKGTEFAIQLPLT
jgi:predicted ATPase/signal transduction histidine kinase